MDIKPDRRTEEVVMSAMITLVVASTAASIYSAYQAKKSASAQKKAAEDAEARAKRFEQSAVASQAEEEKNRLQAVMRSQKRKGAAKEPQLRDTILTSPLGVVGEQQQQSKTLLGQ